MSSPIYVHNKKTDFNSLLAGTPAVKQNTNPREKKSPNASAREFDYLAANSH